MDSIRKMLVAGLVLLAPVVVQAQTWTACNPLNSTTCPTDLALGVGNYSIDFTKSTMSSSLSSRVNDRLSSRGPPEPSTTGGGSDRS